MLVHSLSRRERSTIIILFFFYFIKNKSNGFKKRVYLRLRYQRDSFFIRQEFIDYLDQYMNDMMIKYVSIYII